MEEYKNPDITLEDIIGIANNIEPPSKPIDYRHFEDVYFVFIDILGFKHYFDEEQKVGKSEISKKYKDVFNYYFSLMNATVLSGSENKMYIGQTSDSLYCYTESAALLYEFLKIYSHFSLYAMSQNIFLRGGISKGDLYCKDSYQFFGKSVIRSYLIESTIAKNPLVYMDKKTYSDLVGFDKKEELLGVDGLKERYYINPFAYIKRNVIFDYDNSSGFELKDIKEDDIIRILNNNIEKFEYDSKLYAKYVSLKGIL